MAKLSAIITAIALLIPLPVQAQTPGTYAYEAAKCKNYFSYLVAYNSKIDEYRCFNLTVYSDLAKAETELRNLQLKQQKLEQKRKREEQLLNPEKAAR